MAEAVVSFVLESVRDFTIEEAKFLSGVSHQVEVAQTELQLMQGFLKDADARQGQDETVRIWVAKIRDAAYDLEDVIQTYGLKVDSKKQESGLKNVFKRFARTFKEGVDVHRIGNEIENITTRISDLRSSLQKYSIKELTTDRDGSGGESSLQLHERLRRSYSHVVERDVVGLESNVKELVMHLVKDKNRHPVVSIWGMGGLGKTTLAKQVYHHKKVRQHFHSFAWVCVSQRYQVRNVWEGILFEVISATKEQRQEMKDMTDDEIAKKLFRVMQKMKCLVILDDIWRIETWNLLKAAFPDEETESTILLTTRSQKVATLPNRNAFLHELQPLNENESWNLLEKKAISKRADNDLGMYTKKRELGMNMLRRCKGLPLAIIVLAGVLARKSTVGEWERVHENVHEYIRRGIGHEEEYEGASWVLALSYDDLPYYLKPCFLYLGQYPEDCIISVSTLTKLWVAEGLIFLRQQRHGSEKTIEDIARDCLSELVEMSLVQVGTSGSTGTIKNCRIHDLVRDMCLLKAKEESFLQINYSLQENTSSVAAEAAQLGKIRRLAIYLDENADRLVSSRDKTNGHVRSLLFFGLREWRPISEKGLLSPLKDFKMLRVLKLEGLCAREFGSSNAREVDLPSEIGNMVHLRFLSVRSSNIRTFPPSLGNLVCLQTLDFRVRNDDMVIPDVIMKMKQLRHLYLPWTYRAKGKLELSALGHLQTLHNLSSEYCDLKDVGRLTNLRKLKIRVLGSLQNLEEILKSTGSTLNRIRSLIVKNDTNSSEEQAMQIVSSCRGIYKLTLDGPIAELPKELHNYSNLTKLVLWSCGLKEDQMGILEKLPNLTILKLLGEAFEEKTKILVFSKGGFPSLEVLYVSRMHQITELRVEEGAMPLLCRLHIQNCRRLTTLPDELRYLTNLRELTIRGMPRELHRRIEEDGEDFYKIQHVPSLVIGEPSRLR
ncbi:putative disease resistance protein At1g50180 [Prunus avium]|uniref:Disease resistance protein At1g50180 n=1 Tax=Prunus avium TaxID=42229 RepID=A0A6P5TPK8_PRUAV|nr:putative disease resistance protein At1g50180 [Prunus avium]XP_021828977.1 putative disease resistance protein At1g50180 [Prunus avium]